MVDLIVLIIKVLMGLVICFAGYRLRKILLPLSLKLKVRDDAREPN